MHRSGNDVAYKIVYYGLAFSGKTTNLRAQGSCRPGEQSRLVTLCTRCERTVFFDFLPVNFARIGDTRVKLHLYSVPGQAYYALSRRVILDGVDGIVFVADSQKERSEANLNTMDDLEHNLASYGLDSGKIPLVLHSTNAKPSGIMPVEQMSRDLNRHAGPRWSQWPSADPAPRKL
jgi:signal recognition particle receptor subunit beta